VTTDARRRLDEVKAGKPVDESYDVYGTCRVTVVISYDAAAKTFVIDEHECNVDGSTSGGRSPVSEERALERLTQLLAQVR